MDALDALMILFFKWPSLTQILFFFISKFYLFEASKAIFNSFDETVRNLNLSFSFRQKSLFQLGNVHCSTAIFTTATGKCKFRWNDYKENNWKTKIEENHAATYFLSLYINM